VLQIVKSTASESRPFSVTKVRYAKASAVVRMCSCCGYTLKAAEVLQIVKSTASESRPFSVTKVRYAKASAVVRMCSWGWFPFRLKRNRSLN
jgi:hypothetical protein